jgi:hypothetical protein
MDINRFEVEYTQKLDNYINEYKNYLDNDETSDENLISRNKELQELTTNFIEEVNEKNKKLDLQKKELDKKKDRYNQLSSEFEGLKKTTDTNKDSLVMLKKKEQNIVNNHLSKNKIIKPLFYINCIIGFIVLVGALYITKNRFLLWLMEFTSNTALDIYLSIGTLFKYILTSFFGLTKNNKNNNKNNSIRNRDRSRNNNRSVKSNKINNTNSPKNNSN